MKEWSVVFTDGTFRANALAASGNVLIAIASDSQYRVREIKIDDVVSITPVDVE